MRRAGASLLAACAIAGCGGSDDGRPKPAPHDRSDRTVIAAWLNALNSRRYERAASFFAPGAIVEQNQVFRLPNRAAAVAFNRSLPCRGELTRVKDEGRTTLGTFVLSAGTGRPGASCSGSTSVRFTIERGRFKEWRQLPQAPPQPGTEA